VDPDGWVLCVKTSAGTSTVPGAAQVTGITGNAPNPFNPLTEIAYSLAADGRVSLEIYDVAGRRVRDLVSATLTAGPKVARWDGRSDDGRQVAAGVYFARLRSGGTESLHKLSLVK